MIPRFSKANLLHLRLPFSLLLLPIYLFVLSESTMVNATKAWLVFIIWHFFVYPASNSYNSYFDKDTQSIALLKQPPVVDKSLFWLSIFLEWLAVILSFFVGWSFVFAVLTFNTLSKAYSHPSVRLKKYPIISFLVVFIFQGAFIYWTSYFCVNQFYEGFDLRIFMAGIISSCLIGASYPLTQIYQHHEDRERGDKTLSILLGMKGSFVFSAVLFFSGALLMGMYWYQQQMVLNFYVFIVISLPVLAFYIWWLKAVLKDVAHANYKNAMRMTFISAGMMLFYFTWLWLRG